MPRIGRFPPFCKRFFRRARKMVGSCHFAHFWRVVVALAAMHGRRSLRKIEAACRNHRTRQSVGFFLTHAHWNAPEVLAETALDTLRQLGWKSGMAINLIFDDTQKRKRGKLMDAVSKIFLHAEKVYAQGHTILGCAISFRDVVIPYAARLTQYHGGGAAATVEPLSEHLNHYELMMASNLGAGVQACYRGPRLYDTEETKAAVKKWVDWYKQYREILESDVVHGSSRRADGRDLDWLMHANPKLDRKGMLVVFNPLDRAVARSIPIDLYYTGLTGTASFREREGESTNLKLDAQGRSQVDVKLPARGVTWFVFE